jgi:hypothetical protein
MSNAIRSIGDRLLGVFVPQMKAEASTCYQSVYYNGCYHKMACPAGPCTNYYAKASNCSDPWYLDYVVC